MATWHSADFTDGGCTGCDGCSDCDPAPAGDVDEVMARLRREWAREDRRRERATVEIPIETNAEVVDGRLR